MRSVEECPCGPLAGPQSLLRPLPLADVSGHAEGGHYLALRIKKWRGTVENTDIESIFLPVPVLHVIDALTFYQPGKLYLYSLQILGVNQLKTIQSLKFLSRIPQDFPEGLIGEQKIALQVHREYHISGGLHQRLIALFGLF